MRIGESLTRDHRGRSLASIHSFLVRSSLFNWQGPFVTTHCRPGLIRDPAFRIVPLRGIGLRQVIPTALGRRSVCAPEMEEERNRFK
jgi:hypothetical protein